MVSPLKEGDLSHVNTSKEVGECSNRSLIKLFDYGIEVATLWAAPHPFYHIMMGYHRLLELLNANVVIYKPLSW